MDIHFQQQMGNHNQGIHARPILLEQIETLQAMPLHSPLSRNGSNADTAHIPQVNGDEPRMLRRAGEEYIDRLISGRY